MLAAKAAEPRSKFVQMVAEAKDVFIELGISLVLAVLKSGRAANKSHQVARSCPHPARRHRFNQSFKDASLEFQMGGQASRPDGRGGGRSVFVLNRDGPRRIGIFKPHLRVPENPIQLILRTLVGFIEFEL